MKGRGRLRGCGLYLNSDLNKSKPRNVQSMYLKSVTGGWTLWMVDQWNPRYFSLKWTVLKYKRYVEQCFNYPDVSVSLQLNLKEYPLFLLLNNPHHLQCLNNDKMCLFVILNHFVKLKYAFLF